MKLILGLVFQIGGLGESETRVILHKLTRVTPNTPASYLMMPYQSMALNHDYFFFVGRVGGKFKDLRACSHEHPILESPLRFEQRTDKETLARPYSGYFF